MKPNSKDVANVATISQALNEYNDKHPNNVRWKITWNNYDVTTSYMYSNGWEPRSKYSWSEIRRTHNCGYRLDYRWLKAIISCDESHRKFFYKVFYSTTAHHDIDWDLKEWTEEPSAPYQYMSGGRLYWSDLPR